MSMEWDTNPMGTRRWINVVSLTKYGRDVGDAFKTLFQRRSFDVEYTVAFRRRMVDLFMSIIRRRSSDVYSTSSRRCVFRTYPNVITVHRMQRRLLVETTLYSVFVGALYV